MRSELLVLEDSYTEATISLMVYLVMGISTPPKLRVSIIGRPMADWRVWCVMVYPTYPMPISAAICDMMAVFPSPGAPMTTIGLCLALGMT